MIQTEGPLFEAVARAGIFRDAKAFVDSLPRTDPEEILRRFHEARGAPGFDLEAFVEEHFVLPCDGAEPLAAPRGTLSMEEHIDALWDRLTRPGATGAGSAPHERGDTLIPLPHPYVVPGGRFREVYYWDSYFTSLGLALSGRTHLIEHMAKNFAFLIDTYGLVPNGNRTYYLSRSQSPALSLLLELLAERLGFDGIEPLVSRLEWEYAFWMDGTDRLGEGTPAYRRVAVVEGRRILNRYWDDKCCPREEAYPQDLARASTVPEEGREKHFRDVRAACESGWDFSSRWLRDLDDPASLRTTELVPVDLNCLIYHMEMRLSEWLGATEFRLQAQARKNAIRQLCWSQEKGFFFDYCFTDGELTPVWSLAGVFPLFFGVATEEQAARVADHIEKRFLCPGGVVTTLHTTGLQWDSPNGWAPLQWVAAAGLRNYGYHALAGEIARRFVELCRAFFESDGRMMEKYDVVSLPREGGGGEYPAQDGFGWTNGVVTALLESCGR